MAKKKNDQVTETSIIDGTDAGRILEDSGIPDRSGSGDSGSGGFDNVLNHIQQQDAAIAGLTKRSTELESTLKELLTYLQKQQGVQTDPAQPQQQSQGGGTLETIGGILQTVMKQNQSEAPTLAQQLAEIQLDNMRLMNQYLIKRVIGDEVPAKIEHTTVS